MGIRSTCPGYSCHFLDDHPTSPYNDLGRDFSHAALHLHYHGDEDDGRVSLRDHAGGNHRSHRLENQISQKISHREEVQGMRPSPLLDDDLTSAAYGRDHEVSHALSCREWLYHAYLAQEHASPEHISHLPLHADVWQ